MPAIVQIAEVTLSMPVSNTWPEPGASTVKRITTRHGLAVRKWQTTKERRKVKRSLQTAMPKSCDVGCQAEIQHFQILQPQVGTSTQDKPLESMEPEHPLHSEDTVEDEEVALHTEEEQNMEDVYHIFTRTECSSDIDSALGSESEDDF